MDICLLAPTYGGRSRSQTSFGHFGSRKSARFTGDDRMAVTASQAILTLLAATKVDPADPSIRVPIVSSLTCNRVGFSAILAPSIYELPGVDAKLIAEAERLCRFLHKQLRTDGSIHYTDDPADVPTQVDPAGVNEYPGYGALKRS